MNKFPTNTYEQRKLYNDILLSNTTSNQSRGDKNIIKKPLNITPNPSNVINTSTTTNINQSNTNLNRNNNINNPNLTNNQANLLPKDNPNSKLEENKQKATPEKANTNSKPEKPKVQKIKFDEKTLFYNENGLRKFYDIISQNNFKENKSENLNKLIQIYKNWHFMLFPKYNIEFFTSKIIDLGKMPAGRAYMSRLRKIYKGEENWEVLYNQQDEIMNTHGKSKNNQGEANAASPATNKTFREDVNNPNKGFTFENISFNNLDKHKAPGFNKVTNKLNNVSISNNVNMNNVDDNTNEEIQDLVFQNVEVDRQDNQMVFEVNEEDYMNFDDIHNDDHKSISKADTFVYKNEKRNYLQAFGNISNDGFSESSNKSSKKMKFN